MSKRSDKDLGDIARFLGMDIGTVRQLTDPEIDHLVQIKLDTLPTHEVVAWLKHWGVPDEVIRSLGDILTKKGGDSDSPSAH